MATLNIRKIPDDLYARLRVRAAEEGESMEGFVRARLDRLIGTEMGFPPDRPRTVEEAQARLDRLFGGERPKGLVEELERVREEERRLEARAAEE